MKRIQSQTSAGRLHAAEHQEAAELLQWLIDFLPGAIPPSLKRAVLDESGEVHALLWHRSALQQILEKAPNALSGHQHRQLAELDRQIREAALLLLGAEKGTLQRYRQGRYDRSHWWWYLDDILQEEQMAKRQPPPARSYDASAATERSVSEIADQRASHERRKTGEKSRK